jgi:hypothetical protein
MTRRRGLPPEAGGRDGPDRQGIINAVPSSGGHDPAT